MKKLFKHVAIYTALLSFVGLSATPAYAIYDPNSPNGSACPDGAEVCIMSTTSPSSESPRLANIRLLAIVYKLNLNPAVKAKLYSIILNRFKVLATDNNQSQPDDNTDNENEDEDDVKDEPRRPESATSNVVSDANGNDEVGTFEFEFDLRSFGSDIYLAQNIKDSIDFTVLDGNNNVVATDADLDDGNLLGFLQSDGDEEGDYYVIYEDQSETFQVTVTYIANTSGYYKLRLDQVDYNNTTNAADSSYNLNRRYFETNPVYLSI